MALRRFVLAAPVLARGAAADVRARAPTAADAPALARLLHVAYRGTLDDEGETLADTETIVGQLFGGVFGTLLGSVSEVIEAPPALLAATLVTLWQGLPLVAFVVTAPEHRRQGLARAGLTRAIDRLAAADEPVLRLVVTEGNRPAEALYESLGFRPEAQAPLTTA